MRAGRRLWKASIIKTNSALLLTRRLHDGNSFRRRLEQQHSKIADNFGLRALSTNESEAGGKRDQIGKEDNNGKEAGSLDPHDEHYGWEKKQKGGTRLLTNDDEHDFVHTNTLRLPLAPVTVPVWQKVFKTKAQLHMEIKGSLPHRNAQVMLFRRLDQGLSLPQISGLLHRAKNDPLIDSIFIHIKPLSCGLARVEEVVELIRQVKVEKKVIAYLEIGTEKELAVAAACTEAYCPPSAYTSLNGFASSFTLLSGLGEKVGIEAEVFQRGRFKGGHTLAGDWREGRGVPTEVRDRTRKIQSSLRQNYVSLIASSIGRDPLVISEVLSQAPPSAVELVHAGILTERMYMDQILDKVLPIEKENAHGAKGGKRMKIVHHGDYMNVPASSLGLAPKRKIWTQILFKGVSNPGIAVIPITGTIQDGKGSRQAVGSEPAVAAIKALAQRKDVQAAVLRVDSPGGSALASDIIWKAVSVLGTKMPVITSMGDVAASGGYYVAMGAEKIFASPSTVTGSIGVITLRVSYARLLEWIQVWTEVETGKDPYSATFRAAHRRLNPLEHARVDGIVQTLYDDFVQKVGECRNLSLSQLSSLVEGRVFTGSEAHQNGLVDEMGGLFDAVQCAAESIGQESWTNCNLIPIQVGKLTTLQRLGIQARQEHRLSTAMSAMVQPSLLDGNENENFAATYAAVSKNSSEYSAWMSIAESFESSFLEKKGLMLHDLETLFTQKPLAIMLDPIPRI